MNLGEYPTFFESFYFVRQNNCQFGLDANIENIATYFNLFSVVKLILVKIWHNSCNEFMSWSQKCPDVSLPDVTWTVSLRVWELGIHLVCGDFEISQSSFVCKFCVLWWAKCLKCCSCTGYIHKFTWKPYSDLPVCWKRQTKKKRWLMTTFNKPVTNFLFECVKLELLL